MCLIFSKVLIQLVIILDHYVFRGSLPSAFVFPEIIVADHSFVFIVFNKVNVLFYGRKAF